MLRRFAPRNDDVTIYFMPERRIEYLPFQDKALSGFQLTAPSLERLFIDAALAMTDQMVRLESIHEVDKHSVKIEGDGKETLLSNWLNEVLALFDKKGFLCRRIVFQGFDGKKIQATIHGESHNSIRHGHVTKNKTVKNDQIEVGYQERPDPHFFAKVLLATKAP